jgi:hypothetical protein
MRLRTQIRQERQDTFLMSCLSWSNELRRGEMRQLSLLVHILKLLGCILQVPAQVFAMLDGLVDGRAPLLVQLLKALAADSLPI